MDWQRYRGQFPGASAPAFLSVVVEGRSSAEAIPESAAARLRADLERAAPRKRLELLMDHVRGHALHVLGNDRLDTSPALATLGAAVKYHEDQLRVQRDILPDLLARLA